MEYARSGVDCKKYDECLTYHPVSPLDPKPATHKTNWFLHAKLAFRSILKGKEGKGVK